MTEQARGSASSRYSVLLSALALYVLTTSPSLFFSWISRSVELAQLSSFLKTRLRGGLWVAPALPLNTCGVGVLVAGDWLVLGWRC